MKKYKVALMMVEAEEGLTKEHIKDLVDLLEDDDKGYIPVEIEGVSNSVAIGFICNSYFDELFYSLSKIKKVIIPVLNDWNGESIDFEYSLSDGTVIYMGCDCVTM